MTSPRSLRRRHLLALEPRMMFDAAAVATAAHLPASDGGPAVPAPFADAHAHTTDAPRPTGPVPAAGHPSPITRDHGSDRDAGQRTMAIDDSRTAAEPEAKPRDIIFIDTSVNDYRQLAAEWADKGEVVLIDGTKDGLAQVQTALVGQHDVNAIHVVSHGQEGAFWLGTTRIDEAAIEGALAGQLAAIGRALAPGGDILIYGCDFAEGTDGALALAAFAGATHADVAASTDVTGYAGRGGDWTLEAHRGDVQTHSLYSADWVHTLDPNNPVPISVDADSLTVVYNGTTVVTGSTGYGSDNRSPDVGQGAVATWVGAATYQGRTVDLRATVVSLTAGDAIRFNHPTGSANPNGDDPTFLLRDLTSGDTPAQVQIRWDLIDHDTGEALAADVRFTISDIDGIGGNPNTRESVETTTDNLAYYTRERVTDIVFDPSLQRVIASGTQDENTQAGQPITTKSNATFDWSKVSSFTVTYTLAPNSQTSLAQFYHDGDADFVYDDPVYVSIPRLDLDADDSTAAGADAHFTFTENGGPISVADVDLSVVNPMPANGAIVGATVQLTNAQAGDDLVVGTLPSGITAQVTSADGMITVTLSGGGSPADYTSAIRAVQFVNTADNPSTSQRVIDVAFSNDTLTSNVGVSRIDVVAVNDAPVRDGTLPDRAANDADTVDYRTAQAFADPDGDALAYSATGLPAGLTIDAATGEITGTLDHRASQANGGSYAITVTATDPSNASTTQTFTLTVADPPPTAANDSATTDEDTAVTIDVLANDTDPDRDTLTVTGATAQHGTVAVNPDGTISYTPGADYNGTDTIHYTIGDGDGGTSAADVAVTINPVEDAPRAKPIPPNYTLNDGQSVNVSITSAFSDPDGDPLTYGASGLPTGLTIDPATGVISGTVDRSASQVNGGVYTVALTATDPSHESATQTVKVTVRNPPPVASDDSATTAEDTAVTVDVLHNDTDPDGDPLTVTSAAAQHGSVTINPDNTLTYRPAADYNGQDTIRYTVSDGQGGTSSANVAVTITPVEDAPRQVGTLPDRAANDADTVDYRTAQAFADPDGDALAYSATGLPAGLTIDAATGEITGTLDHRASQANGGSYAITVTATDPSNASTTQTFTLTVADPPPTAANDSATTDEDTAVTIDVLANDTDPDRDTLTVTGATAQHGTVAVNPDGTISYTPGADYNGTDTIHYTIGDGDGGTSAADVAVTINPVEDAPRAVGTLPGQSTQDHATVSYPTAGGFTDPDGDALTYSAGGLPAGLTIDPATGVISGTVDRSASQAGGGVYHVTVTATDRSMESAAQPFDITVTNPPPVAVDDTASTHAATPVTVAVLANDSDPDGDALTVTSATAHAGQVAINPDGTVTYTPSSGFTGSDTIDYTISDGQGGTSSARVAVTVGNTSPTHGQMPAQQAQDNVPFSSPIGQAFGDPDGDRLTFAATGLPPGLTIDPATGTVSGTPDRTDSTTNGGAYDAVIVATDPYGAQTSATVHFTIGNAPPVANADDATTDEDTPVTVAVLANDTDPNDDPITLTGASADHGQVALNTDGTITYTPDPDYNGADTIHYSIADDHGNVANGSVSVTIAAVNDAPRAVGTTPSQTAQDGAAVSYPTADDFTDPDGDPLRYSATGLPAGLTIDPATGIISGTLDRAASQANGGVYHVAVTATDPSNLGTTQQFDITVTNPPPVAVDDSVTVHAGTPAAITLLGNDSDPDGDPLTVVGATAHHGQTTINADGTVTYVSAPGFVGTDTIDYTISDGNGGTAAAKVTVSVTDAGPTHDAIPPQQVQDNVPFSSPIGQAFGDPDGDRLTFAATGLPPGLTIDPATGTVSGTPDRTDSTTNGGAYDAVIVATDPYGAQTSATVHFTIGNAPPVANADDATTDEDTPVTVAVLANDTDPNDDPITLTGASADHGQVAVNQDGTLTYTPAAGYSGGDTIRYSIADDHGNAAAGTVIVSVGAVDHAPVASPPPAQSATDGQPIGLDLGGYFHDPDGDTLTYAATGLPPGLAIDPATGRISGTLPGDASRDGPYHVTVSATDPSGATAASSFDWAIANPAPVARDDAATMPEDVATTIAVLANDGDPDGDPLTVTAAGASHGSVAINPDGTVRYTPDAGFSGNDVIAYTIADSDGATAQAHVLVTVTPVDHPPVANAPIQQPVATHDGTAFSYAAGPLFSDADGDRLTYSAGGLPAGLSIDPATGVISGTIDREASQAGGGSYVVVVAATDPAGASASTTIPLTVSDRAPIAGNDTARTNEDTGVIIPVLANDRDPDGDPLTVVAAIADHGTVTRNADGTIGYLPGKDFSGSDTIRYTIADGKGGTVDAVVTVYVAPVNHAPILPRPGEPIPATGGRPTGIDLAAMIRDPDGDTVTITRATSADGSVAVTPGGVLVFTPSLGFVGTTTVSYTADDGHGGVVTGTLIFRVADGRGADIEQLLRIGRVTFVDPPHPVVSVATDGEVRNPLAILTTVDAIRLLGDTVVGHRAVIDSVEQVRSLDAIGDVASHEAIADEVARLDALRDQRDVGDRLFDHRWHDFDGRPLAGFSAAADRNAQVMIESVVRGGAIQIEVRDTAPDGCAGFRSVDVRPARARTAEWLHVDHRGVAIVERAADMDVLRLVVIVTRTDGSRSVTPVAIQGATGEIEIEPRSPHPRQHRAAPLDATLASHHDHQAAARRLGHAFR